MIGVEGGDSCGISESRHEERLLRVKAKRYEQEYPKGCLNFCKKPQKYGKPQSAFCDWLTARPTESVRLERKSTSFGIYYSKVGYKINSLHNYLHILTSDTRILFFLPVWYTQTIFKGDGAIENI
ncbi:hypothetical protein [Sporosarcina pasteurii]|uniref:hypothetical protein n=1 Tax=Sporosarcina pasteurii TaxID=1474 RepID=UPI000E1BFA01|nr:hypothetical protein [Sporosarcina pasteurii]MDS9472255.1 hypothetical protein [Sporosarcina pasteurii]QBQ06237.1 hypothetical protein E2C16_11430 [Sporosarcina pasteurii]